MQVLRNIPPHALQEKKMSETECLFESLWEEEHNGKQIPIAKKRELRNTALKWFCLGTAHGKEMLKKEIADIIMREIK